MKCVQYKQPPRMLSFTTNRTAPASIHPCDEDVKFADQTELPRNKQHVNVQKRPQQSIDTPMSLNMNMNGAHADQTRNEHNQATTSHLSHRQCTMNNEQRHKLQITECNKTSTHHPSIMWAHSFAVEDVTIVPSTTPSLWFKNKASKWGKIHQSTQTAKDKW